MSLLQADRVAKRRITRHRSSPCGSPGNPPCDDVWRRADGRRRPRERSRAGRGLTWLTAFALIAVGAGAARALTTTYLPVLLERIERAPGLIGLVMLVNAAAGFAVPLLVGVWSDRRGSGSRRLVFLVGGSALTGGGLLAVALGTGTSYLVLAAAAAAVYVGLNAVTTVHRSVVAEDFTDRERPAATSAQELAALIGGMVALGGGGVLIELAPGAAFAAIAAVVVLSALPTLAVLRRSRGGARPAAAPRERQARVGLAAAMRRSGAREVLLAQLLWVAAYAPLPVFFVLFATDALGVGLAAAGLLPAGFGVVVGAGMLLGGRAKPGSVYGLVVVGVALIGGGLIGAAQATSVWGAAAPFAAGALGAGLVSALGFPYFARFVGEGEAGRYSGLFFATRAVASAATLPLAGVAAQLAGTYRVIPYFGVLALVAARCSPSCSRWTARCFSWSTAWGTARNGSTTRSTRTRATTWRSWRSRWPWPSSCCATPATCWARPSP